MTIVARAKWCLGHGVVGQAESLRTGHKVPGYLVAEVFSAHGAARGKGLAPNLMARCVICRSIRRHHDQEESAGRRASSFCRDHAARWVKLGRSPSVEDALLEMETGGVNAAVLKRMLLDAVGERCPGRCQFEEGGVLEVHTIDRVQDWRLDVRDPAAPFTLENIGVLCGSCNESKRERPWLLWMRTRRCAERAWQAAIDDPSLRRPEQLGLFDVA